MAVALGLGAVACSDDDTSDPADVGDASPPAEEARWGPLAVVEGGRGSDAALIRGVLVITDDCVLLDERGESVLLVWPDDMVSWDAGNATVEVPTGDGPTEELHDGDTVRLGGGGSSVAEGGLPAADFVESIDWIAAPDPSCVTDTRWFVGIEASVVARSG